MNISKHLSPYRHLIDIARRRVLTPLNFCGDLMTKGAPWSSKFWQPPLPRKFSRKFWETPWSPWIMVSKCKKGYILVSLSKDMLFFSLLKLLTTIITQSLKIVSSNMQKQKFWNKVFFKSRRVYFLYESPTPPWKFWWHDLKMCSLNFEILENPSTFEIPKVQSPLFSKGGSSNDWQINDPSIKLNRGQAYDTLIT